MMLLLERRVNLNKRVVFAVDAELWKQVKAAAALEGMTMQKMVDQALKDKLTALKQPKKK